MNRVYVLKPVDLRSTPDSTKLITAETEFVAAPEVNMALGSGVSINLLIGCHVWCRRHDTLLSAALSKENI